MIQEWLYAVFKHFEGTDETCQFFVIDRAVGERRVTFIRTQDSTMTHSLVVRAIEFTEFPEHSVTPPFLRARQFHLACFVDQHLVLRIEIFANELNQRHADFCKLTLRSPTNASRISPSHTLIRFGNTSSSNSVQMPKSRRQTTD